MTFATVRLPLLGLLAATWIVSTAVSGPRRVARDDPPTVVDDDPEEREVARVLARRSVQENCLICHSEMMISGQRLTPKQWKAEVEKMVGWGAPLPGEQQVDVIAYLSELYPATAPPREPERLTYAEAAAAIAPEPGAYASVAGDAAQGVKLHLLNCANCHGNDGQGAELGPNLVERPVLLRPSEFHEVVKNGRGRMPGFSTTLDAKAEANLLAWLRTRRNRLALPPSR